MVFPASEETEVAFAVASVHSSIQEQGKVATLFLTLGHFLPCIDKCCRTWKTDIHLCGSKVSISSSCHAPDSSISGMTTFSRASWVKGSSGYRCILRPVIFWKWSIDIKDFSQLVSFGVAKEEMLLMKHLCRDITNTSHVYSYCVCRLQKNFRNMGPRQPQG